jgi:hypothetical protein
MLHKRPASPDALSKLKLQREEYDPPPPPIFTDPPPAPPGEGLRIEKADWRGEEERSRRQEAEIEAKQTAAELDPPPEPRPAKSAKKSKVGGTRDANRVALSAKDSQTPNLDEVKAWRKGAP